MKKYLRTLFMLTLLIIGAAIFAPSAFALGQSLNLTVKTVIDNAAAYPTEVAGLSAKYSAERIYKMQYSANTANAPAYSSSKVFNVANNLSSTLNYGNYSGANCDTFWFTANQYTDKHLSLVSLEYTASDNLQQYTYSPTGTLPNTYANQPFNWVQVIDSAKPASVTLHFKYNPDIASAAPDPDPTPSYSKTIDYLGDGVTNPDTTANGVNDYRLKLDVKTQQATVDNKDDIVFVLDVSGSMGDTLSSGQTKIDLLKSTMTNAINSLTTNPNNRISIIKFSDTSQVLVSSSNNKTTLLNAVSSLSANGCTNYYASLLDAIGQVNAMKTSDTLGRDKVVIFLTDGEPTFAKPAAVSTSTNNYSGMVYGCDSAKKFSNVDKFYSVFIGDNSGSASNLQTITQMVPVNKEKYMVQATNAQQLTDTFNRFLSKMSNSLYNVTISDNLSADVTYSGGMKVTQTPESGSPVLLTAGIDYSVNSGAGSLAVQFLKPLTASTNYALSFNVTSSDKALSDYNASKSYPNLGDPNTDYTGNATSSGKAGFYSNTSASLAYSFGTSGTASKTYNKPVIQVVEPAPVSANVQLTKVLNGKDLKDGMFSFEVSQVLKDKTVVLGTVTNTADGTIKFDSLSNFSIGELGTFTYQIREVAPATPMKGMIYDTKILTVVVTVTRSGDKLVSSVSYPNGQQFVNTYSPAPVYVSLEAKKVLTGKTLAANMFSFNLLDSKGIIADTKQNDASGAIKFSQLVFTKTGIYNYAIRESIPMPADPQITYDLKTVAATITVTDNNGALAADVKYSPDATFTNQFTYAKTNAVITAKKVITGMQLTTGMFNFALTDMDTGAVVTASNAADGTVQFIKTFTEPGTHTYKITEVLPDPLMKYMTYDKHAVTVTITIADGGSGVLKPTLTYSDDPVFYNSYQVVGGIW